MLELSWCSLTCRGCGQLQGTDVQPVDHSAVQPSLSLPAANLYNWVSTKTIMSGRLSSGFDMCHHLNNPPVCLSTSAEAFCCAEPFNPAASQP